MDHTMDLCRPQSGNKYYFKGCDALVVLYNVHDIVSSPSTVH